MQMWISPFSFTEDPEGTFSFLPDLFL